jgi:molybdopterin-dependent oxidoreductase alpha subunit
MEVGPWRLWKKMRSRNACKTCALGMGGMAGGMVNEAGHFPEVCKKSLQAQVADMSGALPADFFDTHDLEQLRRLTPKQAEDAGRLTYPALWQQGMERFKPVTWEYAMALTSQALKEATPSKVGFYASGRSSNEAAFLLNTFARCYGSNHVMNCSFYCHQASGVALKMSFGTGTATISLEDIPLSDLVFLIGANPASNHPRLMTELANLRGRGGQVIVVNPLVEAGLEKFHVPSQFKSLFFGTEIANLYVQPYAGGDIAFLVGVLKAIIESKQVNQAFLDTNAENATEVLDFAQSKSWDELTSSSGVDESTMRKVASMLASAHNVIFAWAMGLTHHQWGVDNVLAVSNVALALGQVGKPGAGMLPIRGHSNVQGIGSIGFTPQLQEGFKLAMERLYGQNLSSTPGYDTYAMIEAAESGNLDVLICLGGNLWGSNPDSNWSSRAMQNIGTTVYMSTKLNPGHFYGNGKTTLILPVLARDEEKQPTTQESMFNYVRLSEGGTANVPGSMKSEVEVICAFADQVMGKTPVDWQKMQDHDQIRKLIAESVPGWQQIADMGKTKKEFTIPNRVFHEPKFNTANGKAKMYVTQLPPPPEGLRLITLRSEGQFNSVVYEEKDIYRGMPHRHCILMSEQDARKQNLKDGQRVKVKGEAGQLENIEVVVGRIKSGTAAMFYPESNVLIKGRVDPKSKTPSFKSAPITVEP